MYRLNVRDQEAIRQIVSEQIHALLDISVDPGEGPRPTSETLPLVQGIPPASRNDGVREGADASQQSGGSGRAGYGEQDESSGAKEDTERDKKRNPGLDRMAHRLAHLQVQIADDLETGLANLDDLVNRAETTAEKIRSILRRTEPRRPTEHAGGPEDAKGPKRSGG